QEDLIVAGGVVSGQVCRRYKSNAVTISANRGRAANASCTGSNLTKGVSGGVEEEDLIVAGAVVPSDVRRRCKDNVLTIATDRGHAANASCTGVNLTIGVSVGV